MLIDRIEGSGNVTKCESNKKQRFPDPSHSKKSGRSLFQCHMKLEINGVIFTVSAITYVVLKHKSSGAFP